VFVILAKFIYSLSEDNNELEERGLTDRFEFLINMLNELVYLGKGDILEIDNRSFNLYNNSSNSILMFFYSTGHLTITWKKNSYERGEKIYERQFNNVRNIDPTAQRLIAQKFFNYGEKFFSFHGLSGTILEQDDKNIHEGENIEVLDDYFMLINELNELIFSKLGEVREIDNKSCDLYKNNSNSKVNFSYDRNHLIINWKKNIYMKGDFFFEKKLPYNGSAGYSLQVREAEVFYFQAENYFKGKGLPGEITSKFIYSDDEEIQSNYIDSNGEVDIYNYMIDGFTDVLINLIDNKIREEKLNLENPITSLFVLDSIRTSTESFKETLRNNKDFIFDENEINEMIDKVVENVYRNYFKN